MGPEQEAFVVYIATFFVKLTKVYSDRKIQIVTLIIDKALVTIAAKYSNFANIFSKKLLLYYQSLLKSTPML